MNPRLYYEKLLAQMPPDLDRAVFNVLRFHIGQENAIEKEPLILALSKIGYHPRDERQVRLAIVCLRKQGLPICSSSGDGGYFLPANGEEFAEFANREYLKKIVDMRETYDAMQTGVRDLWPDPAAGRQMSFL